MKNLIKKLLKEAIEKIVPYDPSAEEKAAARGHISLSQASKRNMIPKMETEIAVALNKASVYKQDNPDSDYFINENNGMGYYQVKFGHTGLIQTQHIKASADMEQLGGKFHPSDVGTCKQYQDIALYCFVKAAIVDVNGMKGDHSYYASPAVDARYKALVLFQDEILGFFRGSTYIDKTAAQVSAEKMADDEKLKKARKDALLAMKSGRDTITMSPDEQSEFEKREAEKLARRAAAMKRGMK